MLHQENSDLFDKYYRDVYHFALYYTYSREDAEDITQETFLKAIKSKRNVTNMENTKAWLLSVAKNTAVDYYRKKQTIRKIVRDHQLQKFYPIEYYLLR